MNWGIESGSGSRRPPASLLSRRERCQGREVEVGGKPAACITLSYRLNFRHVLPHRAPERDPGVYPWVPPGARHRSHAPGDLREVRVLLVRHRLQAPEAAATEGVPEAGLEPEAGHRADPGDPGQPG